MIAKWLCPHIHSGRISPELDITCLVLIETIMNVTASIEIRQEGRVLLLQVLMDPHEEALFEIMAAYLHHTAIRYEQIFPSGAAMLLV